jgi:hypothetical protein
MIRFGQRRRWVPVALLLVIAGCTGGNAPTTPSVSVSSVAVTGWLSPLAVGDTLQLTATAVLSDGSTRSVTTSASWQSTNTSIATVSTTGVATGIGNGSADIRATYQGQTGGQTISVAQPSGLSCGVERWPVKTLSDPAASGLNLAAVQVTTIKSLNLVPTHCSGIPDSRSFPEEFQVFEVVGQIIIARLEDDHDYHIALADLAEPGYTIVTEIADPLCQGANSSPFRQLLSQTRSAFDSIVAGQPLSAMTGTVVRVRGVGFYDFNHNQTGRSQSCLELHAVLSIERAQ